jgi:glutaredoxin-related protein
MDKFYIKAYILDGCGYSRKSKDILSKNKKNKMIRVTHNDKENYKKKNNMNTFPQIFGVYKNQKVLPQEYLIGGNDDLEYLLEIKEIVKQKLKENKLQEYFKSITINIKNYNIFLMVLINIFSI